jgi:hypothetical protein
LDQYVDKLGGENLLAKLLAYSSTPVEKAVNAMLSQRDAQWQIHNVALTELGEIGESGTKSEKESGKRHLASPSLLRKGSRNSVPCDTKHWTSSNKSHMASMPTYW